MKSQPPKVRDQHGRSRSKRPSEVLGTLAHLLAKHEINPADVGQIRSIKVGEYGPKDDPNITTNVIFSPKWETGPEWPVVQPAKPVAVKKAKAPRSGKGWRTAVVLPDPQFGFRRLADGSMQPFHDVKALDVATHMTAWLEPDEVIHTGDTLDLAEWGRYTQEPAFQQMTQPSVDAAHRWLGETVQAAPNARHRILEGNHDERLPEYVLANARAAFGLRPANQPEAWPVLSVPNLLRLDDLGIEYVSGYPNGKAWINDNLLVQHGPPRYKNRGRSAKLSLEDERVSMLYGHIHRIELEHKTRNVRDGYKTNLMGSPGCLCRIDGPVPSANGSLDAHGASVTSYENWQQGIGVVRYQPGNGPFQVDLIPIHGGKAHLWGEVFTA